jgi:predicted site-specific integrase-resolvase
VVNEERLLTIKEVSTLLACSTSTISRWVKQGKIPCFKLDADKVNSEGHTSNTTIRFRRKDVEKFIKENIVPTKQEVVDKIGV